MSGAFFMSDPNMEVAMSVITEISRDESIAWARETGRSRVTVRPDDLLVGDVLEVNTMHGIQYWTVAASGPSDDRHANCSSYHWLLRFEGKQHQPAGNCYALDTMMSLVLEAADDTPYPHEVREAYQHRNGAKVNADLLGR